MTPNRFRHLLDAYGADIERWPPAERAQARLLAAQQPPALRQAIEQARMLDDWLGEYKVPLPSPELAPRVAERAMASPLRRRVTAGWVGIGLASIGLAGMLAGAVAFSTMFNLTVSESNHDGWSDNSDVFGVNIAEWSE